ncbi:GNAT family N-acetyltransferase [Oxalobacteraceae bacterium OM1]|nr:GNAT family N-acetyltransferase [Oxalobacteraceae bacterium OM1]
MKRVRLAALTDSPAAFGVRFETAAHYTVAQWQEYAAGATGTEFWLACVAGEPVGMIGGGLSRTQRYTLIGMWVAPRMRGSDAAERLVAAVKARARESGYHRIFLAVAPDNIRAARFYRKQGFVFVDERESLASHPHITVQTMVWSADEDVEE